MHTVNIMQAVKLQWVDKLFFFITKILICTLSIIFNIFYKEMDGGGGGGGGGG